MWCDIFHKMLVRDAPATIYNVEDSLSLTISGLHFIYYVVIGSWFIHGIHVKGHLEVNQNFEEA